MPMNPRLLRPLATGGRYRALRVGLVAYWPLNEDASSGDVTAVDWTRRGNDLTSNNSVPSVSGKIGNAREFVAANSEYLSRASNADLQFGDGNWSISLWLFVTQPEPASVTFMHAIGKDQSGGREIGIRPSVAAAGNGNRLIVDVFHTDGTFVSLNDSTRSYADWANRWWHFVITHNNGGLTLYRNGSSAATGSRAAGKAFAATNAPFSIGRRSFTGFLEYFGGYIDEVAKWSRALSVTEVSELYNGGNGIDLRQ